MRSPRNELLNILEENYLHKEKIGRKIFDMEQINKARFSWDMVIFFWGGSSSVIFSLVF